VKGVKGVIALHAATIHPRQYTRLAPSPSRSLKGGEQGAIAVVAGREAPASRPLRRGDKEKRTGSSNHRRSAPSAPRM
jgi:hypothetical protein